MNISRGPAFKKFRGARNKLRRYVPWLFVFGKVISLCYSSRSYLRKNGYFESVRRKKPCRKDGSPLPWMNYGVIQFLELRLRKDLSLFEYGSGNSTLFFSDQVGQVVSVEGHKEWFDYVKGHMPDNVQLMHVAPENDDFVNAIDMDGRKFDVVIVDAEDRVKCMINAPPYLSDQGIVLLDDSATPDYKPGIENLFSLGFKELAFNGLKPGSVHNYRTSVFYRDGNCLGL